MAVYQVSMLIIVIRVKPTALNNCLPEQTRWCNDVFRAKLWIRKSCVATLPSHHHTKRNGKRQLLMIFPVGYVTQWSLEAGLVFEVSSAELLFGVLRYMVTTGVLRNTGRSRPREIVFESVSEEHVTK